MSVDFLYIGAPRAGSTWLYRNLQAHPEIWVPPCKNILYFHPRFQIYRLKFLKYFGAEALKADERTQSWYLRFFLKPLVNDEWYLGLFPNRGIKGEIAEAYCSLGPKEVEHVKKLMPGVKIIFTMRNPYERALSHAKLGVLKRKKKEIADVPVSEFLRHINHPGSEARSSYTRTLDLWMEHFPAEQFHIRFYEDILEHPQTYLREICEFLGVKYAESYFKDTITSTVNPSVDDPLPEAVRRHTAKKYKSEIKSLAERFGGPAVQWKEEINELLA